MHNFLRKLELQGFKSFAGKTVLDFPARVVAIVGPNGSGKSNIIDAFRWVLGEREAKQLRGDTLGNLIFGGTEKRAQVSLARVSLVFDNRDKLFPVDAPEVEVSRKIDRSGTSEFSLHDSEVRLKDLSPMLARARLGSRGITMIGQGQGDLFVKSSADERRTMVEEVLGLKEFRIKKTQAERRLDTTHLNMEKTRALIAEIAPHLKTLLRQKHRWEKRSEVADELTTLENTYFSLRYYTLKKSLGIQTNSPHSNSAKIAEKRALIADLEKKLKASETRAFDNKEVQEIRIHASKLLAEKIEAERQLARYEAQREIQTASPAVSRSSAEITETLELIPKEIDSILKLNDIEEIKSSLRAISTKIQKLFTKEKSEPQKSEPSEKEKEMRKKLEGINKELEENRKKEEIFLQTQEESHIKFRSDIQNIENEKNGLRKLEEEEQRAHFEKEKVMLKIEDLERDWQALGRTKKELESLPEYKGEQIDFLETERKMFRLRGELSAIGEIDESLVKEADETEKRHLFLTKELEDLEKAKTDLEKLVKELDERIHKDFKLAFNKINDEFNNYFQLMFGGGKARMKLSAPKQTIIEDENGEKKFEQISDSELSAGLEIDITIPRKRITSLDMLSGGEKSLVSLAALFALISVSPPPFLVLDEIDAPLDEDNARRFAELVKVFSKKTQFIIVTHNRATMETADVLYGITMGDDGVSKVFSLKLE